MKGFEFSHFNLTIVTPIPISQPFCTISLIKQTGKAVRIAIQSQSKSTYQAQVIDEICICEVFPTLSVYFSASTFQQAGYFRVLLQIRPYMKGCLVTFCINTGRPLHYSSKMLFQWFYILCMYFSASTFQRAGYFQSFCNFAPICKAPLYERMFGNFLYKHKKAFALFI